MIQRIQTVYLFAVFAIGLVLIWQDPVYAWFDGVNEPSSYVLMFWNSYVGSAPGNNVLYTADLMTMFVSLSAMAVSILSIFFFKNRKFQMKMVMGATLLCVMLLVVMLARYYIIKLGHPEFVGHLGIPLIWPGLMAISGYMAYRGVRADEQMVRSMDRIR